MRVAKSDAYTLAWLRVMRARPEVNFYVYTKEVARFRALVEPDRLANLAITAAGWHSQAASDLLAVLGPRPVGTPANRIPRFLAKLGWV